MKCYAVTLPASCGFAPPGGLIRLATTILEMPSGDVRMNSHIYESIMRSAAVPSMPQVATRFLEVIQDPNFDYDHVVKVLSVDAGTVSEILRLSNSALFGVVRKVTSLKQALTLLGPRRTRSLVLGRYLVEAVSSAGTGDIDTTYFWRRSLVCGVLGAKIADLHVPQFRDEVFLSGLLADIGITILAQALPTEYGDLARRYTPQGVPFTQEDEQEAIGTTHAEVSAMVLDAWSLPEIICKAVRLSHTDVMQSNDDSGKMPLVLNASDRIARLLCEIPNTNTCAESCRDAMELVGMELSDLIALLDGLEADVRELASILKIDVISSSVYQKIADAIRNCIVADVPA
jgi:HD-like signal output (HDOD) protein